MAKKKPPKKEIFYVGIPSPAELRRDILESTKEFVRFLQRYEKFKAIRKEKLEAIAKAKEDMQELKTLINKLKRQLPKTKLRIKHEEIKKIAKRKLRKEKREKPKEIKKEAKPAKPKKLTELEKLESELSEIEGKLKTFE